MKVSDAFGLSGDQAWTETTPPVPELRFLPGTERRGALPHLAMGGTEDQRFPVGPYDLRLQTVKDEQDNLILRFTSPTLAWRGHAVLVVVHGDGGELITEKLVMEPAGETGAAAEVSLGPVDDLVRKLGDNLGWAVFPPRELAGAPESSAKQGQLDELIRRIQDGLQSLPKALHSMFWRKLASLFGLGTSGGMPPCQEVARLDSLNDRYAEVLGDYHALRASLGVMHAAALEASGFAIQRLKELVAKSRHQFWAPTAWLFIKEGDTLRAVVRRRTEQTAPELKMDERSVSTFVARTGKSYFTNDPPNDEHWRDTVPARASMAAPIKASDGEVIGVICLESYHETERFSEGLCDALAGSVAEMVPHVHVLRSLHRADCHWCSWHPRVHRWDLALILRRICHAAAEEIERKIKDEGIECAIWSVDRSNREIWIYAVSGYGIEFLSQETLVFDSFTGCVADCASGTVGRANLGENGPSTLWTRSEGGEREGREGHRFLSMYRRTFMGLTEATATPIHLADSPGKAGDARYVLAFYAYGDTAAKALPSREEQVELARVLGDLLSAYLEQRDRLAAAYFAEFLAAPQGMPTCVTIMREFTELLKLQEAMLYLRCGHPNWLMAVEGRGALRPLGHHDGNWEYLRALLAQPGVPVRTNNENSRRPDVLIREAAGWLPWHDPEGRRFLDIGVKDFGVIRLVRSKDAKPFTPDDEQIVVRLAGLCGEALRGWVAAPVGPNNAPAMN